MFRLVAPKRPPKNQFGNSFKRHISFAPDAKHLEEIKNPKIQEYIRKIDENDKKRKIETIVTTEGMMNQFDMKNKFLHLPSGRLGQNTSDPMLLSAFIHELQHAKDHDIHMYQQALTNEQLERRAYQAEIDFAASIGLPGFKYKNETAEELAKKHSQVKDEHRD